MLFAQPELLTKIKRQPNFYDRIGLGYVINALNLEDTRELINFRLRRAGLDGNHLLFSDEAVNEIFEYSKGSPRKIVNICHEALVSMIRLEQEEIDKAIIEKIIKQKARWDAVI